MKLTLDSYYKNNNAKIVISLKNMLALQGRLWRNNRLTKKAAL
jgi:hypothetical protein